MPTPEAGNVFPLSSNAPVVLVVDDDLGPRAALCRMVRGIGYRVRTARGGREALRHLQEHPGQIRVLLTDLCMPRMDGGELAERALDLDPRLRIVLMSEPVEDRAAELLAGYPELPYLEKPVGFGALYSLLVQMLGPLGGPETLPRSADRTRSRARERQL
ncbi:MAG: response regulator [Gemmatimonadales bacterium]|nr:response regulator [Gemmatimonadales bacterium]